MDLPVVNHPDYVAKINDDNNIIHYCRNCGNQDLNTEQSSLEKIFVELVKEK